MIFREDPRKIAKQKERFFKFVAKFPNGCWLWLGGGDPYGHFYLEGKQRPAHIVSWEWENGTVPDRLELDHICLIKRCVNPDHLEPVTSSENKLRYNQCKEQKTACINGHPYTEDNLYIRKNGTIFCKACNRIRAKRNRQRKLH